MPSLDNQLGISGLSLGSFSTTCDIVKAISAGLELWDRLERMTDDVRYFRAQLVLQKDLLDSWYADWFGSVLSGTTSLGHLRILSAHKKTIEHAVGGVKTELARLDPITVLSAHIDATTRVQQFRWVADHKATAEAALDRIERLLRGLYLILPPQSPHPEARCVLSMLNDSSPAADRFMNDLAHTGGTSDMLISARRFQKLRVELDSDLQKRIRNFEEKLPHTSAKCSRIDALTLEADSSGTRSRKVEDGREVIVEWKDYPPKSHGRFVAELIGRCESLAQMLRSEDKPVELLTLPCAGFFDDVSNRRYGFVFQSPAAAGEELVSLNHLFQRRPAEELPTLEERYTVAHSLSLALSIVFAVGWLHKGLRSHNILFLRRDGKVQYSRPYLVGFAYSREDKPNALSEKLNSGERFNLYKHAGAQPASATTYRQEYDVYSFGVLLFEIARWASAFPLWPESGHDATAFKASLCSQQSQKQIAHRMGSDYCTAMLKCLEGGLSDSDGTVSKSFYVQVVEVLRRQLS